MFFLPALLGAAGAVASGVGAAGAAGLGALGSVAGGLGSAGLGALSAGGNIIGSGIGAGSKFLMGSAPGAGLAGPAQQGFLAKTLGSAGAKALGKGMVDTVIAGTLANSLRPKPPSPPPRSIGSSYSPGFNVQGSPYQSEQGRSAPPTQAASQYAQPGQYRPRYDRVNQAMKKKYGRTFFV